SPLPPTPPPRRVGLRGFYAIHDGWCYCHRKRFREGGDDGHATFLSSRPTPLGSGFESLGAYHFSTLPTPSLSADGDLLAVDRAVRDRMPKVEPVGVLSRLSAPNLGVFRGRDALRNGVTRDQLARLRAHGIIE